MSGSIDRRRKFTGRRFGSSVIELLHSREYTRAAFRPEDRFIEQDPAARCSPVAGWICRYLPTASINQKLKVRAARRWKECAVRAAIPHIVSTVAAYLIYRLKVIQRPAVANRGSPEEEVLTRLKARVIGWRLPRAPVTSLRINPVGLTTGVFIVKKLGKLPGKT